jgi:hypothetical protein
VPGGYSGVVMVREKLMKNQEIMPHFKSWFGAVIYQNANEYYALFL